MGQTEFYVYLNDAAGNPIAGGEIVARQGGEAVPVLQSAPGYKVYGIDPSRALTVGGSHAGYEIDTQEFHPPYLLYTAILTGGQEGDAFVRIDGARRFFSPRPDLIAVVPEPSAWHAEGGNAAVAAWMEAHGLQETGSPWTASGIDLDGEPHMEVHFYQRSDGQAFSPWHNEALQAIRQMDIAMVAGIPLWENTVFGNVVAASASQAPEDWLAENGLALHPQEVSNGPVLLEAAAGVGHGIVELYEKMVQSGFFPAIHPQVILLY